MEVKTTKDFWNLIDSIDIDSREDGRYTEEEMYTIGCAFIGLDNSQKREIGGWDKVAEILKPLDKNGEVIKKGDIFRQWVKRKRYAKDEMIHNERLLSGETIAEMTFSDFEEKAKEIKRELYVQQTKFRDERRAYAKVVRDEARVDSLKELMLEAATRVRETVGEVLGPAKVMRLDRDVTEREAVMLFSDMHLGTVVDSFFGKYNSKIAAQRAMDYARQVVEYCEMYSVKKLVVLNLGDMISGHIHTTGRIEADEDLAQQVMDAAEIVASVLEKLQDAAPVVEYRSCTDNHGRMTPDHKQNIEAENFSRLIDFYLKARLAGTDIKIINDNLDVDLGLFKLGNGKNILFTHGHRDKDFQKTLLGISNAIGEKIDYLCVGHLHSVAVSSVQGSKVFVNGSIMGSDSYATSRRLYGPAAQSLLIFDGNNVVNNIIDVNTVTIG